MTQTRHYFDPAKLPVVYHPGEIPEEKLMEMGMVNVPLSAGRYFKAISRP